ncbi:hypothetical protein QYM36_003729 [Artemia franciscana]|uniref:Endonuclease/exonuclease/phosphatase domain-containing protein n=1 Tax=Artemia franciscana TaxID=6661 RepID=A0AA88I5D3_ARTSF|nr:hypothetical protein QYM36_003729 [Artemia franciscana]
MNLTEIRKWETPRNCQKPKEDQEAQPLNFTIMSYNVLAQGYIETMPYLYGKCNEENLKWPDRKNRLFNQFKISNADSVCLQEVEADHYCKTYLSYFQSQGYDGVFKQKTQGKIDGCATFFKKCKFSLKENHSLEMRKNGIDLLNRDNIALISILTPIKNPDKQICIVNTHLLYNRKREDVRLAQLQILLAEINRVTCKNTNYFPVILCGDLNLTPSSKLYSFLSQGRLKYEHLDIKELTDCVAKKKVAKEAKQYKWIKTEPEPRNITWKGSIPHYDEVQTPLDLFRMFITEDILSNIADQTNLNAMRKKNLALKLSIEELRRFLGVQMLMSILKLPAIRNPEEIQSIDEQMIPFKGTIGFRQYLKDKPHSWGVKVFTRAGISGIVYDIEIYTGKGAVEISELGQGTDVVLRLVENLPRFTNFKLFFDNFYTGIDLIHKLRVQYGIESCGTIRSNRMRGAVLDTDANMKKKGRGSVDFRFERHSEVSVVKWYDNKAVHLASSYCAVTPIDKCQRWDGTTRKYVEVDRPRIVRD